MIEFRWVKVGMDHKDYNDSVVRAIYHFDGPPLEISTEDVVLQWRISSDRVTQEEYSFERTEGKWQTVPFDPNVKL